MQTVTLKNIGRLSLSVRVSLLLMLAALLPLIITIISSELLSRPQLIAQANTSMATDAQSHIQAIENYFSQPVIDVSSLSQNPVLADYLTGDTNAANNVANALRTSYQRNINYISWSLIDLQNNTVSTYPAHTSIFHGKYAIPLDTIKNLNIPNRALVSSAFFNPQGDLLTVDVTEPVTKPNNIEIIGYVRATLNINFIWNTVLGEQGVNGKGSYAFITDENGVIIAHSDITQAFVAIAPFTANQQNDIGTLVRYGQNTKIPVLGYDAVSNALKSGNQLTAFEMTPPGQTQSFQVIGKAIPMVPWTYFVLSPTSVVTGLADQQLLNVGIIGLIVLLLAAVVGLFVGRGITAPVLRSVAKLRSSSQELKDLAAKEQVIITEQIWVVDSSKTGLSSVHYYTNATSAAAHQIYETGSMLEQHWSRVNPDKIKDKLHQIVRAAHYIETATQYQKESSKKLSAAIDLTQQVTEQLASSANLASSSAEQMEQVVGQLQQVAGTKDESSL